MDYILGVTDNLFFDRLYASVLPASLDSNGINLNATVGEKRFPAPITNDPMSDFLGLRPSELAYGSLLQRDDWQRQAFSLFLITWLFGLVVYYVFATASYVFIFDKDTFKHPKFLKNQIQQEMRQTMISMPVMSVFTTPFFLAEVRGYSRLYADVETHGTWYMFFQLPLFLVFTDFWIYLIHRVLHHKAIYKTIHKPHHKWIMPTPFASHAFHPVDGFSQSVPYHVFPFIFPLHKLAYIGLFMFINIWTIMIHDGEYIANSPIINGAACHTMHHLYFNYNYGQYTTLWDRLLGSYRKPNMELFYKETKMGAAEWEKQVSEMETIVKEVEGDDLFREYEHSAIQKKNE